ncbi:MAG: hypothetical protein PHW95_03165 [Patescibacteria group bacterium]|nr:hypothetical protein [Patescibacteria group bacterium]
MMCTLTGVSDLDELSHAHWKALANKCGGLENVIAVLQGEQEITLREIIKLLIDRNGRGIPDKSVVKSNVCDANRAYYFDRLPDDYDFAAMLSLWQERFKQNPGMDAKEFRERIAGIRGMIAANRQIRNLDTPNAAPWFPLILPQIPLQKPEGDEAVEAKQMDYGTLLEDTLLPAVEASYIAAYPQRQFINYRKGELSGQVTIVEERHAKLYQDLANGPIIGILFPTALHGFSPFAQREMITLMPEHCSLEGPMDMGVAETLYTRQLSRDNNTPVKDCSAVQWRDPEYSLYFNADDDELGFDYGDDLGLAYGGSAGGVFFRG